MAPEDGEPEMIRRNGPWSRPVLVDDRRRGVVHVLDDAGIATYGPGGAPRTDRPWVKPLRPFHGAMDQQGGLVLAGGGRVVAVSAAALDDPGGPVDTSLRAAGQTGILAVCVDRGGQTWVGHQYLGLHRIREQRALEPSLPDGLAGVECRSLLFDDDGRLMIGFADIGLVCEQPEGWLHKRELWIVRALERLGGGRYAASADSAFVVLDDRKEVVERIQPAIGRIYDLLLESDGAVLIGGEHGAARWRDGIVERMELPGADATPITALERAGDDLWIGGTGACWRVRGDDVVRFDASLGMPGGAARCAPPRGRRRPRRDGRRA